MTTRTRRTARRAHQLALAAVVVSVAVLAAVGQAGARTGVDPSTLNPPPPDFFNAQCFAGAGGTVCTLGFSDEPFADEPSGIVCDGVELLYGQSRSVVGKRYYDANGDLVRRHFREQADGTFTNPVTRKSVPWTQHDTVLHDLTTPGDLSTGAIKVTGLTTRVTAGGRTIIVDAGTTVRSAATDEILQAGGQHPFDDYFVRGDGSALAPICAALA